MLNYISFVLAILMCTDVKSVLSEQIDNPEDLKTTEKTRDLYKNFDPLTPLKTKKNSAVESNTLKLTNNRDVPNDGYTSVVIGLIAAAVTIAIIGLVSIIILLLSGKIESNIFEAASYRHQYLHTKYKLEKKDVW